MSHQSFEVTVKSHASTPDNLINKKNSDFFSSKVFFGVPHLATYIFYLFRNEPGLGTGFNPGMASAPFPSSVE